MEITKHDLTNIYQSSIHHFSGGYRDRGRRSPPYYDESEPEDPFRIFVALFDYDPLSMSPNPDAADEELPFKEGQIIKVRCQVREPQWMVFDNPPIVIKIYLAVLLQPLLQVYGDKDTDGFYRGQIRGRSGLIPCNMVSEIQAEDEETMDQLMKQGFLPLNTPVDRIGTASSNISSYMLSLHFLFLINGLF